MIYNQDLAFRLKKLTRFFCRRSKKGKEEKGWQGKQNETIHLLLKIQSKRVVLGSIWTVTETHKSLMVFN